ncbi:MAG: cupin-like domain-containing protein [Chloroflexota bacterium]|nr:cupin-like domain-containing protein [Chloroflexota bacterium]
MIQAETRRENGARTRIEGLLEVDWELMRANYNRRPFLFRHRLAEHPLMQLDSLVKLANRLPSEQVLHCKGRTSFAIDFDAALKQGGHSLSVEGVLRDMENMDAYVMIRHAEKDPPYGDLAREALDSVRPLVERLDPGVVFEAADIFIASPGAITPYHMDREMNFLCQIRGTKEVNLWDQEDASILAEHQIDQLFGRPGLPKPGYKPEYAGKAMRFTLSNGVGIHQPLLAPHAVQNGSELSIAIAITYRSKACHRRIMLHKANYALRKLGLHPRPHGQSPLIDNLKITVYRVLVQARALVLRRRYRMFW